MKIFLLIFVFATCSVCVFAQNLTLSEILAVREKSIVEAEEYLSQRGWSFYKSFEEGEGYFNCIAFAYNLSDFDQHADSFIMLYYSTSNPASPKRISIQANETKYNEYLNQIKNWGGKLINSYTKDDCFYKIYQGTTITYIIKMSNRVSSQYGYNYSDYLFNIMVNEDYNSDPQYK